MSYFTDPMSAIEEAEFIANSTMQSMYVVEVEPNRIEVLTPEEAYQADGIALEKISPTKGGTIYDYPPSMRRSGNLL